ncbi:DUF7336 domain-containing protein [Aquirhabdus parva]|uniref:DUF7336 domain-containing protein n=1 Tax=Aquirhabdus parva TaxID=2283318 RepID=A0A345P2G1_9GAMM|nr:hypothetical protein [Aquirhabdus parva]AXI01470.1 hypothetical protein HYN46_00285 [Aquirhabdus parva]
MSQKKVYLLQHWYDEDDLETYKILAVFSSKEKADEAREYFAKLSGFRDYPEDFIINSYVLDELKEWTEGFVSENDLDDFWKE